MWCSCKQRSGYWRRFLWGRTGSCLGRDSEVVFTLSPSPQVLSEPRCGYPCAQPGTSLSCPAAPGAGLSLGTATSAGPQQGLGVWAAPGSCSSSVPGREGKPPSAPCPPSASSTSPSAIPGSAMGWAAQHTLIWGDFPSGRDVIKPSVFCRLSDGIHKAVNTPAPCTGWAVVFHWVQQFPEAPLSACFQQQDFGCQACKNILCERNGCCFHSTFG